MNIKQFSDIRAGEFFREISIRSNPRVFIKMQNVLPSGIKVHYNGEVSEDHKYSKMGTKTNSCPFNAVDMDGIPASCPDWVKFVIIDNPFKTCGV